MHCIIIGSTRKPCRINMYHNYNYTTIEMQLTRRIAKKEYMIFILYIMYMYNFY